MIILKIGGGKSLNIQAIIKDLAAIYEPVIIVHGANALRDELAEKLGYEKKIITSVKGYNSVYTDDKGIDIMMMAYSGLKNKRIVELCRQNGINAVGLTGLDGGVVAGKRNAGIRVKDSGKLKMIRDNSGKPCGINTGLLNLLLSNGYTPVLTVPISDENGKAINSENDDVVALLQKEINADKIIQLIEEAGYLADKDSPESVIKNLTPKELQQIEEKSEGRMKRKIHALNKLFESGSPAVYIADGRIEKPVTNALNGGGTTIK